MRTALDLKYTKPFQGSRYLRGSQWRWGDWNVERWSDGGAIDAIAIPVGEGSCNRCGRWLCFVWKSFIISLRNHQPIDLHQVWQFFLTFRACWKLKGCIRQSFFRAMSYESRQQTFLQCATWFDESLAGSWLGRGWGWLSFWITCRSVWILGLYTKCATTWLPEEKRRQNFCGAIQRNLVIS